MTDGDCSLEIDQCSLTIQSSAAKVNQIVKELKSERVKKIRYFERGLSKGLEAVGTLDSIFPETKEKIKRKIQFLYLLEVYSLFI